MMCVRYLKRVLFSQNDNNDDDDNERIVTEKLKENDIDDNSEWMKK